MIAAQLNAVVNLFNQWAVNGRSDRMADGHKLAVDKMFYLLHNKEKHSFLDVGCGNGWAVRKAAQSVNCTAAFGIDMSDEMIKLAEMRKFNSKEHFICENFLNWKVETQFDVILSMEVFYYIYPAKDALKKAFDLLNNQGNIMVGVDFYKENKGSHHWPEMVGLEMQLKSAEEWGGLFESVGFKNISVQHIKNPSSDESWKREFGTLLIMAEKHV